MVAPPALVRAKRLFWQVCLVDASSWVLLSGLEEENVSYGAGPVALQEQKLEFPGKALPQSQTRITHCMSFKKWCVYVCVHE